MKKLPESIRLENHQAFVKIEGKTHIFRLYSPKNYSVLEIEHLINIDVTDEYNYETTLRMVDKILRSGYLIPGGDREMGWDRIFFSHSAQFRRHLEITNRDTSHLYGVIFDIDKVLESCLIDEVVVKGIDYIGEACIRIIKQAIKGEVKIYEMATYSDVRIIEYIKSIIIQGKIYRKVE